jgi:hypothetical protein
MPHQAGGGGQVGVRAASGHIAGHNSPNFHIVSFSKTDEGHFFM